MSVVVIAAFYGIVAFVLSARVTTLLAWHFHAQSLERYARYSFKQSSQPEGEQWFGAMCIGALVGVVWPLALIAFAFKGRLFAPPRDVQIKRQEKRIAELERELELGGRP